MAENAVRDTAVVTLKGDTLVATGIGTAVVRIGDEVYNVTVEVAPISLLLLAGQSNMEGSEGNASQSIVCPDGMVYATYGAASAMNSTNATNYAASALTGQYRTVNVNGTTDNLSGYPVYALTEAGSGKIGADSGIAYEWVQQTGEKVWVVNAAHGGSAISTWKKGGANYNEAVALFSACQETLRKEIAAGHYTLNHMGYFWCQGCADETQTAKWYADQYLIMHEGLKTALAADMDSNSATPDMTLEFGGIIPIRSGHQNAGSYRAGVYTDTTSAPYFTSFKDLRMNGPRVAQYWMGSNPELTDIWNVCTIQEDWATMPDGSDGVAAYFRSQYNNGRVDYTTQVKQSDAWYTPTTPTAVHDSIHYNQIGYNEIGRESARNALIYLGETEAPKMDATVKFVGWDGFTEVTDVASSTVGSSGTLVVPMVSPVWKSKDVTYSVTAGLQYNYYDLLADAATTEGTLTAKGAQGGAVTATPKDPASYRWEFNGADLVSVTTGDNTQNTLTKLAGTITDGVFTDTRFRMSEPVVLRHDRPWVVEWKMTGNWTGMILSANDTSNAAGNTYLFKTSSNTGFLGFGEAGADGKYHNYGTLLGASVDFTQPHVYRVENRIAADGSNMAYLLLDGVEVGPMNRYYIGGNSDQNKNVNWVNGRDFVFGQIGTSGHTLTKGSLSYLTVMEDGERTPKNFRWEFDGNDLVSKGEDENDLKKLAGSSANGVFSNTRYQLEKAIILRHDLPWVMEWQGAGAGGFMLANGTKTNDGNNYFFHRANNTLEAFGYRNAAASMNYNYGVSLQSVLDTGSHKYRLENRIAADGSNMVYLTVDNQSAYRMDGFFHGGTAQGTTGDWISGQDFSFNYIGAEELPLTNYKLDYLTVVEDTGNVSQKADYRGKVISVLGDSISTFAGYIPVADGFNLEHLARYPQDNLLTDVNETWWMQVIGELDAKLGINDSWRGATVSGAAPVTTGTTGENAAMHNLTRIQNLGSNGTPDVILLYGGTNDLAHVSKVGTFDPDTAPSAAALTTTKWDNLADGFVHTLLRLQHYYPDAEIVAMLPTYTASYYSDEKLAQGNAVMTAICEHYGVPYVDLRDCGITTADLPDGIHPDAAGMDYITDAVLETLFAECEMTAGESTVYSVTHSLTGVKASLGHYKGISANQPFTETLAADGDMTVTVTMGGKDITASAYQNGVVSIPAVTGHVAITAKAAFSLGEHLQQLPGNVCCGSNLWQLLDHDKEYYTVNGWDVHASGTVYSVTVPVQAGEKVYASSFGAAGINGSTFNGIRVTFFGDYGVLKTMAPAEVYAEFSANGYLTAPAGTVAVNVPMWTNADSWELYLLDREHTYDNGQCSMCGDEMLRISLNELVRYQGGVNSLDGTLNTTFTNNWYSDIRIPEGAEQVRFLMFKTGGDWGSAFFKGSTYLSGVCDKTVGGYWKTLDVPEEATTLRYGYLYDEIATNAGYPAFEYLEFVGEDLTVQEDSGFMDRPATGCHSFSVKVNIAPAQGNPTGYAEGTDYGYIQLPTNYTSYGEPTRLIIVCHGAGANLATYQSNAWKNTNYSFWTDLGYAVMDMYASPAELTGNNSELHYGSPIVVDCYKEGYDYVMEHFNLKQDGVFLIGSSMGGLSSFQIAQSGEFPVIAQVGYCPAIDLFKQAYVNPWTTPSYQRSKIAAYFGFDGTAPVFTDSKYPSAAEIAYYKDNFAKTIPYSPILSNVVSGSLEKIFDVIPSSATAASAEEEALYQQLTATHPNPLMIFHNTDDGTVAYRYSKYFVDMVNRSGQEAVLRTFTSGAHNAWANGNSHTVQGLNGNITIKDSQYEAYLFFQKYEEHAEHIGWTDPAVAPTCTKSGLTEGSHCAVCGEILTAQQSVPATGVHTYENGVCTGCGEAEVLQGSIRLRSATLNLLDKVCIIYKASDDLIPTKDADVAERGVLLYDSAEKAASKDPALAYETVQLTYDPAEGRYVGQTEGIDARDMERSQFAVAYLKLRDGTYVFATREGVDQVQEYSPLIYCRNKMSDPVVGKLCRAMMHYGAAAQVLQYGMTTGLMNEGFEAIPYDAGVLGTEVFSVDTTVINGMRLRSATMDLQGAISYIVKYEMTEDAAGKPLYAEYTLLGQQGSVELEYHAEENRWWATINGVPAKDLGAVLTVKPYWLDENGAKMYGGELVYSGNEYVRRTLNKADNPENLQALARAIAMYVHYADEYGN